MTALPPDVVSLGDAAASILARVTERQDEIVREFERELSETLEAITDGARVIARLHRLTSGDQS